MNVFEGLYGYEIVLLVMGGLLFLVALAKLIFSKPTAVLGVYFVISISMVGYSSVQSINYKDGVLTLNKKVHDLENNPNDQTLRASLKDDVAKIQERPSSTPETKVAIAQANFALGNEAVAKTTLNAALQSSPNLPAAKTLNEKIAVSDQLKTLSARVEAAPEDSAAKQQLSQTLTNAQQYRFANPVVLENTRRAQQVLRSSPSLSSPSHPNP